MILSLVAQGLLTEKGADDHVARSSLFNSKLSIFHHIHAQEAAGGEPIG
jgi:predicted transcriptional regulator YheO